MLKLHQTVLSMLLLAIGYHRPVVAIDTVVVRPALWSSALSEWKAYRESQGHRIAEIDSAIGQSAIRDAIQQLGTENPQQLKFVLLAGDVTAQATSVPTFYHQSTAMSQFGGDRTIASDNAYGDLNNDQIPELAVGRIPADSAEQLKQVLSRVIAFEQQSDFSRWRRDVHVIAGVGGFGAVADSVIEMTTRGFLADRIPGWSEMSLTQASLDSHYCPDPRRFSQTCVNRMNQGGMFWVYIGHGHVQTLDYVRAQAEWLPILTHENISEIQCGARPPIAIFLACYTGAFDAIEDSLAEELMLSKNGPIACLAASRVSGPYGLAMLSDGLLSSYFDRQVGTLGEVVLSAKQSLLSSDLMEVAPLDAGAAGLGLTDQPLSAVVPQLSSEAHGARKRQMEMIAGIASALSPQDYDLEAERREHLWEMNLLGDPLLRISHPSDLKLWADERVEPGQSLVVSGRSDIPGKLTLEFAYRRDQVRRELNEMGGDTSTELGRAALQQRYLAANQRVLSQQEIDVDAGEFHVELAVPVNLPRGKYAVRGYLEGQAAWRVGYLEISVRGAK